MNEGRIDIVDSTEKIINDRGWGWAIEASDLVTIDDLTEVISNMEGGVLSRELAGQIKGDDSLRLELDYLAMFPLSGGTRDADGKYHSKEDIIRGMESSSLKSEALMGEEAMVLRFDGDWTIDHVMRFGWDTFNDKRVKIEDVYRYMTRNISQFQFRHVQIMRVINDHNHVDAYYGLSVNVNFGALSFSMPRMMILGYKYTDKDWHEWHGRVLYCVSDDDIKRKCEEMDRMWRKRFGKDADHPDKHKYY